MNRFLADALRAPAEDWIPQIFYEDFQSAQQWINYIDAHYPSDEGIKKILDKERGWSATDFQALYIACWIYKPVVKGSYMLKLSEEHKPNVAHAYKKLSSRWTSHLHGPTTKGAEANTGWRFLRSYHELLVQFEQAPDGPYLFLKCEGHPAVSYAHYKSWKHKKKTGVGLDVNEVLLLMASDEDKHLGIKVRAAENYSTAYRELLRTLGQQKLIKKQGEIIHTRQAAVLLLNAAIEAAQKERGLQNKLNALYTQWGVTLRGTLVRDDAFENTSNTALAQVFELLASFCDHIPQPIRSPVLAAMFNARNDMRSIAVKLRMDGMRENELTVRYFEEVVVTSANVDAGLEKARRLLSMEKGA